MTLTLGFAIYSGMPDANHKNEHYIGELSKQLSLSPRAIRFYEELGLISPTRTEGGFRVYSDCDVFVLKMILTLKDLGMALGDIRSLLSPVGNGSSFSMAKLREALRSRREEFTEKARLYTENISKIDDMLGMLSTCACCADKTAKVDCKTCIDERKTSGEELAPILVSLMPKK